MPSKCFVIGMASWRRYMELDRSRYRGVSLMYCTMNPVEGHRDRVEELPVQRELVLRHDGLQRGRPVDEDSHVVLVHHDRLGLGQGLLLEVLAEQG